MEKLFFYLFVLCSILFVTLHYSLPSIAQLPSFGGMREDGDDVREEWQAMINRKRREMHQAYRNCQNTSDYYPEGSNHFCDEYEARKANYYNLVERHNNARQVASEETEPEEEAEGRAATIEEHNNGVSQYNACLQNRQNAEGVSCTGQAFAAPLIALANQIQAQRNQYSMRQLCEKARQLNQQALAANGGTIYLCRRSLAQCVHACESAAEALRVQASLPTADPSYARYAYEANEHARICAEQSQQMTQNGMLQAAQNVQAIASSGECANLLGGVNPNELNTNQINCENYPPELAFVCENPTPENCSSPQHQNQPYCQTAQIPDIPPFEHVTPPGFCVENPELCELDRGRTLNVPDTPEGSVRTADTLPLPPGFDPNALVDELDDVNPRYFKDSGHQPLGGAGRSGGGNNNGLAGGSGGALLGGGGGAGGFGLPAEEQEYEAGGDGIYDTDILKGIEGGIASAASAVRGLATSAAGKAKNFIKDKFKGFSLKDYLPGKEKTPTRNMAGQASTLVNDITPANGLSNWQKVSRMMREKRPLLLGEKNGNSLLTLKHPPL